MRRSRRRTDRAGSGQVEPSRKWAPLLASCFHNQSKRISSSFIASLACIWRFDSVLPCYWRAGSVKPRNSAWKRAVFQRQQSSATSPITQLPTTSRTQRGIFSPTYPVRRWALSPPECSLAAPSVCLTDCGVCAHVSTEGGGVRSQVLGAAQPQAVGGAAFLLPDHGAL